MIGRGRKRCAWKRTGIRREGRQSLFELRCRRRRVRGRRVPVSRPVGAGREASAGREAQSPRRRRSFRGPTKNVAGRRRFLSRGPRFGSPRAAVGLPSLPRHEFGQRGPGEGERSGRRLSGRPQSARVADRRSRQGTAANVHRGRERSRVSSTKSLGSRQPHSPVRREDPLRSTGIRLPRLRSGRRSMRVRDSATSFPGVSNAGEEGHRRCWRAQKDWARAVSGSHPRRPGFAGLCDDRRRLAGIGPAVARCGIRRDGPFERASLASGSRLARPEVRDGIRHTARKRGECVGNGSLRAMRHDEHRRRRGGVSELPRSDASTDRSESGWFVATGQRFPKLQLSKDGSGAAGGHHNHRERAHRE